MKKDEVSIGTWPTPEEPIFTIIDILEYLNQIITPTAPIKELAGVIRTFYLNLCPIIQRLIREDIYVICKHSGSGENIDHEKLCQESQLENSLERLSRLYPLYRRLCCH